MDVGRHGRGQHHARQVVVAEHQRTLVRAGRQDHPAGPDLPQQLARTRAHPHRQMIGQPLGDGHQVVVLVAEGRAARQDPDIRPLPQARLDAPGPAQCRLAVDLGRAGQQAAAQLALFVHQDHARAGRGCRVGGRQSRRSAAQHQHIAMGVALVVALGIAGIRRAAQAGGRADPGLVTGPQAARPHEGLVIEAGGQEARQPLVDGQAVALQRRFRIHAGRRQALVQLDLGGARIRHAVWPGFELHDGVGLLHPRRDDAARAVILEAAGDETQAIGQQRRGQRVARVALVRHAVEREMQGLGTVDAPPASSRSTCFIAHLPARRHRPRRRTRPARRSRNPGSGS